MGTMFLITGTALFAVSVLARSQWLLAVTCLVIGVQIERAGPPAGVINITLGVLLRPAGAAHVLAFHPGRSTALFLLARLVQRPTVIRLRRDRGLLVQPGRRIPPGFLAHRRRLVPRRPVQQPLRLTRRPVARELLATDHPFRDGRPLASADTYFPDPATSGPGRSPDRSSPSSADRSRTALRAPHPAATSRPCFIGSSQAHDLGRLPSFHTNLPRPPRLTRPGTNWLLPY